MVNTKELQKMMDNHLKNLTDLTKSYDDGNAEAALGMAVSARAIFHDGIQSVALLNQLGLKNLFFLLFFLLSTSYKIHGSASS